MSKYTVRAARCDHRASDEEIFRTLERITAPLSRSWEKISAAGLVVIKANMVWPPEGIRRIAGRRQELVDDSVLRAVLRLLRDRTSARLVVADTTYLPVPGGVGRDVNFMPLLQEFGADYVECSDPPLAVYDVPGGGFMFSKYLLHTCIREADAVVSVAKLKSHAFMGVTLCLKNLFGLSPLPPRGKIRTYYHHIIRLSYVLPDLGMIVQPCLNIIDALTGQSRLEWDGDGRLCDALIAGDHVIATDACGAYLMGHDPASDWPAPPFRRDRNPLRVAAERGFGSVDLAEMDFELEVKPPLAEFDSQSLDSSETVASWRRTMCEQALHYLDHRDEIVNRYGGEYIFLQDGEVVWNGPDPGNLGSRRDLSGDRKDSALWLKLVDPDEQEGEHFEVYSRNLTSLSA
ncbi:MAG: DUF362 domain-containing protein [Planctomycetota bacterium]